jgi:pyruvate kinase
MIWKLAEAGMNVARLNMSHGDHASHQKVIDLVKEYNASHADNVIAIMLDTKVSITSSRVSTLNHKRGIVLILRGYMPMVSKRRRRKGNKNKKLLSCIILCSLCHASSLIHYITDK